MTRITVDISDADLTLIDAEAKLQNASRSKLAAKAIDAYPHQKCSISDAEVMQLKDRMMQLQKQLDAKIQECDAQSQKTTHLNDELDRIKSQFRQDNTEATKRWEELKSIKNENTKLKKDLDASQATIQRLQADLINIQTELDKIVMLKEELAVVKTERDKLQEAMDLKGDEISFLRGHVAQLTQSISQLSLKPGEEEIKKKGWWQFWK